jgi:glycosidase
VCAFLLWVTVHAQPDVSIDGPDKVKAWADIRLKQAEADFASTGWSRMKSPEHWSRTIYQIQVDRFNNGNPANDKLNIKQDQQDYQSSADLFGLPNWRHGGDLEGIRQRIPYFVDLGIEVLWITPVLKHDGSYHGYCMTDPTDIDPGFGTKEEFRRLVKECHDVGIRVVLDIVVNHLCDPLTFYNPQPDHKKCTQDLNDLNWSGIPGNPQSQGSLIFSEKFFKPLKSPLFFNRCGANTVEEMSGEGTESLYGDFTAGMLDLDTRNWDFQEIFTKLMNYWIAYADVDGFRLDAVKHVTEDFLAYLSTYARDYALKLGKDDFLVVGEVAGSAELIGTRLGNMFTNPDNPDDHGVVPKALTARIKTLVNTYKAHPKQKFPGMTAAYDFNESGRSKSVFLSQNPPMLIEQYFKTSEYDIMKGQANPQFSWTLLEIHDWIRFLQDNPYDWGRAKVGLTFLLTMQGSPVIYYGLEQGFNGVCDFTKINAGNAKASIADTCNSGNDSRKRQNMFVSGPFKLKSAIPAIDTLAMIGQASAPQSISWETDPFLNRNHDLYITARKASRIRKSCPALQIGSLHFLWSGMQVEEIMIYSRRFAPIEAIVILNPSLNPVPIPVVPVDAYMNTRLTKYVDLMNPQDVFPVTQSLDELRLQVPGLLCGYCVRILIPQQYATAVDPSTGAAYCNSGLRN